MTQEIIPSSPYYGEGSPLSARELQRTTDLADAVEKATIGGDGGSIGDYTGLSYVVSPELEIMIIITGQYPGTSKYAWSAARRNPTTPELWEIDPDGPSGNYDNFPAREINNSTTVPLLKVCRAWVSNQDGGMSLDFDAGYVVAAEGPLTVNGFNVGGLVVGFPGTGNLSFYDSSIYIAYGGVPGHVVVRIRDASPVDRGVVTTVAQTFGGNKSFNDLVTLNTAHHSNVSVLDLQGPLTSPGVNGSFYAQYNTLDLLENPLEYHGMTIRAHNPYDNNKLQIGFATMLGYMTIQNGAWPNLSIMMKDFQGIQLYGRGSGLNVQRYACNGYSGMTGSNGATQFNGGIWVGGPCPGAGGGGGLSDGTYGDIVVTGGGTVFTIGTGAITTPKIADGAVTTPKLAPAAVTPPKLSGGTRALIAAYG